MPSLWRQAPLKPAATPGAVSGCLLYTSIDFFQGDHLVIVNRTPTPRDRQADLCLAANVGDVFDF